MRGEILNSNPYASPTPAPLAEATAVDYASGRSIDPLQLYVDWLLRRGILFSIMWLAGFGSIYSVYLSMKAHKIIRESQGKIRGRGRVLWCYVVGGIGCLLLGT